MTKKGLTRILFLKVDRFFKDVYPNFHAKSWLGSDHDGYDKRVDNFMDDVVHKISGYRR